MLKICSYFRTLLFALGPAARIPALLLVIALLVIPRKEPAYTDRFGLVSEEDQVWIDNLDSASDGDEVEPGFLPGYLRKDLMEFDLDSFLKVRDEKQKGIFTLPEPPLGEDSTEAPLYALPPLPKLRSTEAPLPFEAQLSITGRKLIEVKYGTVIYDEKDETKRTASAPAQVTQGMEMQQELQVKIKGKVGERISVDVDYDDTREDLNKRKISVIYQGREEEFIQSAAFGDITLSLPSTEFVSYKKQVFGIQAEAKYKDLNLMAIGSQTKGFSEVKKFKGNTTFAKKDIYDINYVRRKYYQVHFSTSHLPLDPLSEEIWLDDRVATNNTDDTRSGMTVKFYGSTSTYSGDFDLLSRGEDYTIDYIDGVITFRRPINSNHIIAVSYRTSTGVSVPPEADGNYVIKAEQEDTYNRELKNRYYLGNTRIIPDPLGKGFLVRVMDKNRTSKAVPGFEVDYDAGLLVFSSTEPFSAATFSAPEVYNNISPEHNYIIYVEYRHNINTYMLRFNIVKNSERVFVDGRLVKRDSDYILDYDSGFLTFLNEDLIGPDTEIEITYEYYPFIGQTQETLVGTRGEWQPRKNFFLGSTLLYRFSGGRTSDVPDIRSTPTSLLVMDSDFKWDISSSRYMPLKTKLSGEYAKSIENPNVNGNAMIEDMEGAKQIDSISMNENSWQLASNPDYTVVTAKDAIVWSNEDLLWGDISLSDVDVDEEIQVLNVNYNMPPDSYATEYYSGKTPQASIVYPMSVSGVDLSKKTHLEMWVKAEGVIPDKVYIHVGRVNENSDNKDGFPEDVYSSSRLVWKKGQPKTEDLDGTGSLSTSEDNGWSFFHPDGTVTLVGYQNARLDSQDLDGDGYLSYQGSEEYGTFDITPELTVGEWKRVFMPVLTPSDLIFVKHARITIQGASAAGKISFASMGLVGSKWEDIEIAGGGELKVFARNNKSDPDYESLIGNSDYESLYINEELTTDIKEQTLALEYRNLTAGTTALVRSEFGQGISFYHYEKIRFFIYDKGSESGDVSFVFRIGSSDNDYYEYRAPLNQLSAQWELMEIDMGKDLDRDTIPDDFTIKRGSPNIKNITQMKFGIVNNSGSTVTGEVWVNEVHASGVKKRVGEAERLSVDTTLPGWFSAGGKFKNMDRYFQNITGGLKGQDVRDYSGTLTLSRLSFLPMSGHWTKSETYTPAESIASSVRENAYLSAFDEGYVESRKWGGKAGLKIRSFPDLGYSYDIQTSTSNLSMREDITETHNGTLTYSVPFRHFMFPKSVHGTYKRSNKFTNYDIRKKKEQAGFEDLLEEEDSYTSRVTFEPWRGFSLTPSYARSAIYLRRENYDSQGTEVPGYRFTFPKSGSYNAALKTSLKLLSWLKPTGDYSMNFREDFKIPNASVQMLTQEVENKNVSRTGKTNFNLALGGREMLPGFKPVNSLNLNSNYSLELGDTYQNVPKDEDFYSKLWIEKEFDTPIITKYSKRDTIKEVLNWTPLEFIRMHDLLSPLGTLTTRVSYTNIRNYEENTGTPLAENTFVWPDYRLSLKKLEKFPVFNFGKLDDMSTDFEYTKKDVEKLDISHQLKNNWLTTWRYRLFKTFSFTLTYKEENLTEENLKTMKLVRSDQGKTYSGQINFNMFTNWTFFIRDEYSTAEEFSGTPLKAVKETVSHVPSLRIYSKRLELSQFRLPFFRKGITTRLKVDSTIKADIKRNKQDAKANTDTYSFSFNTEGDASENIRFRFGMDCSRRIYQDEAQSVNNYWALAGSVRITITF